MCNGNKAGYTAELVACDWAGAVMQKLPKRHRKSKCVTDRPTDLLRINSQVQYFYMKKSSIQDQAQLSSSTGFEMTGL